MKRFYENRWLRHSLPRQRGFSLLEVMVTLAIVSVGALGMAGLQTVTLRTNNNALFESQAATLAQDLIERVRANPEGDYATNLNNAVANTACMGTAANCNADTMARYDLMAWKCSLGASNMSSTCANVGIPGQLPNGGGSVTVAGNIYTISIQWSDAASNEIRTIVITTVI